MNILSHYEGVLERVLVNIALRRLSNLIIGILELIGSCYIEVWDRLLHEVIRWTERHR